MGSVGLVLCSRVLFCVHLSNLTLALGFRVYGGRCRV